MSYRIGGTAKIDNKDLRRLEIYRGDTLETVDLIAVEERGLICPARVQPEGAIIKLIPPQMMLSTPLKTGTKWDFDGTIGDTKVNQRYEIVGEEDVDVPAGKFHAWRIHCEQILPTPATIDRWFVPTTGFVKVETAVKGPSGGVLQKSSLSLKERPKVTSAPQKNSPPQPEKLSAGVSNEPRGEFKTDFKSDAPAIYARWRGQGLPDHTQTTGRYHQFIYHHEDHTDVGNSFLTGRTDRRPQRCHALSPDEGLRRHGAFAESIEIFPVAREKDATIPGLRRCCRE